ncbi:hypothetical protein NEH83_24760 [Streptomyces sp. JUS-F4]|uniref:hypothetical protein n=1 Tax=Streptomyces sp. JUS-F4 TaxID=2951988 RepID=UPI002665A3B8|nr:hypothetical protein [Streptomyces sp. JUS-F4]WKN17101.1 hypothetical protein NEH83_24760 [Streptomyces sp. JUS-F4]
MAETEFEGRHGSRIAGRSGRAVRPAHHEVEEVVGPLDGQGSLAEADDDVHPVVRGQTAQPGGAADPVPEVIAYPGEVRPEVRSYRVGVGKPVEAEPSIRIPLDPESCQPLSEVLPRELGRRFLLVPHRLHQTVPRLVDGVGGGFLEHRRREQQSPLGCGADGGHLPAHLAGTVGHRVHRLVEPSGEVGAEPAAVASGPHQPRESRQFPHGRPVAQVLEVRAPQIRGAEGHPVHAEVPGDDGDAPGASQSHRVRVEVRRVGVLHPRRQDDDHVGPRFLDL